MNFFSGRKRCPAKRVDYKRIECWKRVDRLFFHTRTINENHEYLLTAHPYFCYIFHHRRVLTEGGGKKAKRKMKKRTKGKSRGRKISGTSKRMISTVPRHSFNAKLIDTGRRRVCHVFAQAEQRIFCRTKLQLNAIAICDAQARTRELGTSCPLGYVHIVHRSTKKRTALERERERDRRGRM